MKCTCKTCDGSGEITCPDCDGDGFLLSGSIESIKLTKSMPGYETLAELQADARRVRRQSQELTSMMPQHAPKYAEQLAGILAVIEKQADEAMEKARQ